MKYPPRNIMPSLLAARVLPPRTISWKQYHATFAGGLRAVPTCAAASAAPFTDAQLGLFAPELRRFS